MSRQSSLAVIATAFDAFLATVLESTPKDTHATLQGQASILKAMLRGSAEQQSSAEAKRGPATQPLTVTVADMGSCIVHGVNALADLLQLSGNTCSASLSKFNGEWRLPLRNDPHTGNPTVDMTVERGEHGQHSDRVADFIKLTLPGSVRGRAARQARADKARKAAVKGVPRGGNKLKAVPDLYEN